LTLRVGLLIQIVQVDFVVILVFKGVKRSVWAFFEQELRKIWRGNKVVLLYLVTHLANTTFGVPRQHVAGVLMRFIIPSQATLLMSGNLRLFSSMQRVADLVWHLLIARCLCLRLHLLLNLWYLLHRKFLPNLLLRSTFHRVLSLLWTQVVLGIVYSVFAVRQCVYSWLNFLHLWNSLLGCILICTPHAGSRLWGLSPS
jgi:hypothetical protein